MPQTLTEQSPIEELGIRFRTCSNLHRAGIETVGDITRHTVKEIMRIRNLGKASLADILVCLDNHGFRCVDCPYEKYPHLEDIPDLHIRIFSTRKTTQLYTCDACHYTFPAYNMPSRCPDRCPDCGKETVISRITVNGKERITSAPAVRIATAAEIENYERVRKEIEAELALEQQAKQDVTSLLSRTIRFISLLLQHNLSTDEHNMALILGYSFLSTPAEYTKNFLLSALNPSDSISGPGGVRASSLSDLYYNFRRIFSAEMQTEKRRMGEVTFDELYRQTWADDALMSDSPRLVPSAESMNADTPALNFMRYFNDGEQVICLHTPNLSNVRKIPYKEIAENPSEEYKTFLRDWYNML